MDKEAAEILAAAMHNMAEANKLVAAASAVQAESNSLIAGKMDELTNTIRGAQMRIDRGLKPSIDRAKQNAADIVGKLQGGKR